MDHPSPIWTFLPGLHGSSELYGGIQKAIPAGVRSQFVELPNKGSQRYPKLAEWLDAQLERGEKRLLVAESFSGPLAIHFASMRPEEISGIVLASSFCDAPQNPGIALLPLRPLFMVKPPKPALRHFLIGDDARDEEVSELRAVIQKIPSKILAKRVRSVLELQEQDNPLISDIPMMILQAQDDNLVPWDAQQRLEACYPDARVHWLESPHLILQRYPDDCTRLIKEFAADVHNSRF